jgi:hypothetical protein
MKAARTAGRRPMLPRLPGAAGATGGGQGPYRASSATGCGQDNVPPTGRLLDSFNLPPSLRALVWPSFEFLGAE